MILNGQEEYLFTIGVLYLLVFVSGVLSVSKQVDSSDYLANVARSPGQVKRAIFFQFLLSALYMLIGGLFGHVLDYDYVGVLFFVSRVLGAFFAINGALILWSILNVSREYNRYKEGVDVSYNQKGDALKKRRDIVNHVGMIIILCVGSLLLYFGLLDREGIPVWLAIFGVFGAMLAIVASLLVQFGSMNVVSRNYIAMNLPIVLQEMIFAIWLIHSATVK